MNLFFLYTYVCTLIHTRTVSQIYELPLALTCGTRIHLCIIYYNVIFITYHYQKCLNYVNILWHVCGWYVACNIFSLNIHFFTYLFTLDIYLYTKYMWNLFKKTFSSKNNLRIKWAVLLYTYIHTHMCM